MKISEMAELTLQSGVTPIVFDYQRVRLFESGKAPVRTFMVLNTLELGTLTYKEYRFVARRTKQGNHMVKRHIEKLIRLIPDLLNANPEADCFTIPVYARLLKDGELARMLFDALTLYPEVPPSAVCIELSADILYEDINEARERIKELRELGVKIAICEVGDEFCPVFRLAELAFDYAFLDEFATASLDREDNERVAGSLVKFLHYLNVKVVAPLLETEDQITGAKNAGCDGYTVYEPLPFETLLPTNAFGLDRVEDDDADADVVEEDTQLIAPAEAAAAVVEEVTEA